MTTWLHSWLPTRTSCAADPHCRGCADPHASLPCERLCESGEGRPVAHLLRRGQHVEGAHVVEA
eukprot:1159913-Prorocentrum_minimum.AAC.7